MNTNKLIVILILTITLIITAGCGAPAPTPVGPGGTGTPAPTPTPAGPPQAGTITGVITDGRSGPGLADVTVAVIENGVEIATDITESDGSYSIEVTAMVGLDIVASKTGYGGSRFQNLTCYAGGTISVDLVLKKVFNSAWSVIPPTLTVLGVAYGATVSANVNLEVNLNGVNDPREAYLGIGPDLPGSSTMAYPFQATLDTTKYPDGDNLIHIVAYDYNNNGVETVIPIVVDNSGAGAGFTMKRKLYVTAVTEGDDLQNSSLTYFKSAAENRKQSLSGLSAETNSACYVKLEWSPEFTGSNGFGGYRAYRSSTADGPWQLLGAGRYDTANQVYYAFDKTAAVTPGVESFYKVVPVSAGGTEGSGQAGSVTPLGRFQVDLAYPPNNCVGVELTTTLAWSTNNLVADYYDYILYISGLSDKSIASYGFTTNGAASVVYDPVAWQMELKNNREYQWDISYACAVKEYSAYSVARSFGCKNTTAGSFNGAFVFTTIGY